MRSSIQLEEVLNLFSEEKVKTYISDLEVIIKKLFYSIASGVDDSSYDDILKHLCDKAEEEQRNFRNDAFESCRDEHPQLFETNAFNRSSRNTSIHPSIGAVKDARRRHVEAFMAFIDRSYVVDNQYEVEMQKVQQLINHFYCAGYGLSQAMFAQKNAFTELQEQAEIIFEVNFNMHRFLWFIDCRYLMI